MTRLKKLDDTVMVLILLVSILYVIFYGPVSEQTFQTVSILSFMKIFYHVRGANK